MPSPEPTGTDMLVKFLEENQGTVRMTFSKNCISGIADNCGCHRCRKSRGGEVTLATEDAAEARSKVETKKFRDRQRAWIREQGLV